MKFTFRKYKYKKFNEYILCIDGKQQSWYIQEEPDGICRIIYASFMTSKPNMNVTEAKKHLVEQYCKFKNLPTI
jgi:hypothetical protein